ncbi:MAG: hypothetical protein ABL973_08250 [Micropepsaceae bacterium]
MLRLVTSTALAAVMFASAPAIASTGHHMEYAKADTHRAVRSSEACHMTSQRWNDARYDAHGNPHLKSAQALAARAHRECASPHLSLQKRGAHHYRAAIRLLGMAPP